VVGNHPQAGDADWQYFIATTQLWGIMALRLADAPTLPFDHVGQVPC
jgi:hypothetical protein